MVKGEGLIVGISVIEKRCSEDIGREKGGT